jgi:hypothetical protein
MLVAEEILATQYGEREHIVTLFVTKMFVGM